MIASVRFGLVAAARLTRAGTIVRRLVPVAAMLALAVLPAGAVPAPTITATKDDGVASTAKKAPGSTITYTVTITNSGGDAAGVTFTDATPTNTTIVAGSVVASPIAINDAYTAIGNTRLYVGVSVPTGQAATTSSTTVLANDLSPATGGSMAVTALNETATTRGGTVTLNADGTFVYTPPANWAGTDTFTYTLANAGDATLLSTATVSITVSSSRVWYVDNSYAGANGAPDGRSHRPFTSLAAASTASGSGDTIFVHTGSGGYTGGITLNASQTLAGQGAALVVNATTLLAAGTAPTITNSGGNGVLLSTNNTLNGFSVGNCSGNAISGSSFGTLTVSNVSINTNGQALNLNNGTVSASGSGFSSITSSGGSSNIFLSNVGGTMSLGSGALSGAGGHAFWISGGNATITYNGSISKTAAPNSVVSLNNLTGGSVTLSGNLSRAASTLSGISVQNCSGATIEFSGASKSIGSTLGNSGVTLTGNTNCQISFTNGGLVLTTVSGIGLNAASNSNTTLRVTGAGNTIATQNGSALNVNATTIHANGLTFQSISAGTSSNGPTNAIVLSNTGTSGGLTVTGTDTTAGSGGTIQKTSGVGVSLNNACNVSLANMIIQNCGDAVNENGIRATGLTGTCSLTRTTVTGSYDANAYLANTAGSLTLTLADSNFNSARAGDGFHAEASGTAQVSITGTGCQFNSNVGLSSDGFEGGVVSSSATSAFSSLTFSSCQFNNNGALGTVVYGDGTGDSKFNLTNNSCTGNQGGGLALVGFSTSGATAKLRGVLSNNTISHTGSYGLDVVNSGLGVLVLEAISNTITSTGTAERAISVVSTGSATTAATAVKLASNTISLMPAVSFGSAIYLQSGSTTRKLGLNISTNNVTVPTGVWKLQTAKVAGSIFEVQGLSPSPASNLQTSASLATLTGFAQGSEITVTGSGYTAATVDTSAATAAPLLLAAAEPTATGVTQASSPASERLWLPAADPVSLRGDEAQQARTPALPPTLTQSALDTLVTAARIRWESTGLTATQCAHLAALRFEIADLAGWHLGEASGTRIRVDHDAGGRGWFVATDATDADAPVPADRVDLFTAVLHEMGHALGLPDSYLARDRESVMFGWLRAGERRLPALDEARDAQPHAAGVTHFLSAPLTIGTIPAGKSVTIKFTVQIDNPVASGVTQIVGQGVVSGSNFSDVVTDDPEASGSANSTITLLELPATAPTVTTPTSASIAGTTATLGGNVTSDGNATLTERGVVFARKSENASPQIGGTGVTKTANGTAATGVFTVNVSNLVAGTEYAFAAYATNSAGTGYSSVGTFTTLGLPTVTTADATNVAGTSVTLGGEVTADGGASVAERGIVYSVGNSTPTTSDTKVAIGSGTGAFSQSVTGLTADTTYSFRAYAINSQGTAYGNVQTFTPDATPPTIVSIVRLAPSGQTSGDGTASFTFRVTYSEAVQGVTTAQFSVEAVNGSTISGSIASVSGSGATRDVTVTLTSGSGEFRLKPVD